MTLRLQPISLRAANAWVAEVHRHHGPTQGHKFSVAATKDGELVGVAIAGRPVARSLDNGQRLEVIRVATDGTRNACSLLYGAVRRAALAMGYAPEDVLTYTLEEESGASLRGAGWWPVAVVAGRSWSRPSRAREDAHPLVDKVRWQAGKPDTPGYDPANLPRIR